MSFRVICWLLTPHSSVTAMHISGRFSLHSLCIEQCCNDEYPSSSFHVMKLLYLV